MCSHNVTHANIQYSCMLMLSNKGITIIQELCDIHDSICYVTFCSLIRVYEIGVWGHKLVCFSTSLQMLPFQFRNNITNSYLGTFIVYHLTCFCSPRIRSWLSIPLFSHHYFLAFLASSNLIPLTTATVACSKNTMNDTNSHGLYFSTSAIAAYQPQFCCDHHQEYCTTSAT